MKFNFFLLIDPILWLLTQKSKKPKEETPQALEIPTTDVGAIVPVLFGERLLEKPILVSYGDLNIKKVKVSSKGKK